MSRISRKIFLFAVIGLVFQASPMNAGSLYLSYTQRPVANIVFEEKAMTSDQASGEITSEDGVTFSFAQNLENGYEVSVMSSPLGPLGELQQGSSAGSLAISANGALKNKNGAYSFSGKNAGQKMNIKLPPDSKPTYVLVTVAPK